MDIWNSIIAASAAAWEGIVNSFGTPISVPSLLCPLVIGFSYLYFRRGWKRRPRVRAVFRGLFARNVWLTDSTLLDMKYVLTSIFAFTAIIPLAILNFVVVEELTSRLLVWLLGPATPSAIPESGRIAIVTVMLYLAYEIAYWTDHYLSHKVRFLWEFHKVHHSAKTLTPFTNWRVHPVDTIVFFNITGFFGALCTATTSYWFAHDYSPALLAGQNVIFIIYFYALGHLQHSQLWISANGWLGHLILSPAHHQIHHSTNPKHYDKNFGAGLAVWDWMFGTLYVPSKKREKLTFGVEENGYLQSLPKSLAYPFFFASKHGHRQVYDVVRRRKRPDTTPLITDDTLMPAPIRASTPPSRKSQG